ncbi:hypothetical protein CLIB1423_18S02124 [[Candida] railenensis]|uniref:Kinesin motor domain-containing protein n=1 Tax=[Candida] railenensis TaxID=45579 RepID=A0A9P0QTZ1_9ASCO|nr:hypothetical protein CLIB1423_18S02124 [[Candida] railenensis]
MSDGNINVVVRVRPLLPREDTSSECLVSMPPSNPRTTILEIPQSSTFYRSPDQGQRVSGDRNNVADENLKTYEFDESIWSFNSDDSNYIDNILFYERTSPQLLDHFFQGFNVCVLAYGQTGSGKTHTMMGTDEEPGMIPLLVKDILRRKESLVNERTNCQLKLQYMEIYNEQVKDLLLPSGGTGPGGPGGKCRIREHPVTGPYVENLVEYPINSFSSFLKYLEMGNHLRSTASTSMNETSSRSHAILTLSLVQTKFKQNSDDELSDSIGEADEEVISNIKLVDLAGSERLNKTKVFKQQDRMKEGASINKSLTVLGRCINMLSEKSAKTGNTSNIEVVPYRDSILTYILKENLAGNSKTFMLFCISPIDFEESYQTLNYANQVKRVKTSARANKKKITGKNKRSYNWDLEENVNERESLIANNGLVVELKSEVQKLSEELLHLKSNEQQSLIDQEKWNKLTMYLENQSNTVQFENKYLHSKLRQKSAEIEELKSQLTFMNQEVIGVISGIEQDYTDSSKGMFGQIGRNIIARCEIKVNEINEDLDRFEPSNVF